MQRRRAVLSSIVHLEARRTEQRAALDMAVPSRVVERRGSTLVPSGASTSAVRKQRLEHGRIARTCRVETTLSESAGKGGKVEAQL